MSHSICAECPPPAFGFVDCRRRLVDLDHRLGSCDFSVARRLRSTFHTCEKTVLFQQLVHVGLIDLRSVTMSRLWRVFVLFLVHLN